MFTKVLVGFLSFVEACPLKDRPISMKCTFHHPPFPCKLVAIFEGPETISNLSLSRKIKPGFLWGLVRLSVCKKFKTTESSHENALRLVSTAQ